MKLIKCKECGEAISKKAEQCPKCGAPVEKKTSPFTWIFLGIFIAAFLGILSSEEETKHSTSKVTTSKQTAMQNISIDYSWYKDDLDGSNSLMEADFTISNYSGFEVKDIEITCTHFAKSGTSIDSNTRTIFDVIPARQKVTFKKFSMGPIHPQAASTNCKVTDLKV